MAAPRKLSDEIATAILIEFRTAVAGAKKLRGTTDYSLRVGVYRILYEFTG
ncbi:type II toxin-antitoxin system RelE family toxin [Gloeomargarita lithophora]|uniref:type II toxin-antitoxin system RelE family toxin n=1 Tax=Gloeomargarita lithophora TaxID=1188228 RepID=UPI0012FDAD2E|nr:hypothetical protein [Gloeomargarita lithophora]